MKTFNKNLLWIMFAPVLLVMIRLGYDRFRIWWGDCQLTPSGPEPCFINGTDVAPSIYAFSVGLGFAIIPKILLWFIVIGLAMWIANIIDGRRR